MKEKRMQEKRKILNFYLFPKYFDFFNAKLTLANQILILSSVTMSYHHKFNYKPLVLKMGPITRSATIGVYSSE